MKGCINAEQNNGWCDTRQDFSGFVAAIFPLHEIFWLHTLAVEEDGFLTADGYNFSMTHNSGHAFLSQMQDDCNIFKYIFSDAVQKYQ